MHGDRVLTVAQVAERLQMHPQTVRQWIKDGKLKAVMPGGTKLGYRIPESEVARLLRGETAERSIGE